MRLIISSLLLILIAAPAHAEGIFRGFVWGVTKQDVRQFEKAAPYKSEENRLVFLEKPDRFRRMITYDFQDGKLIGAKYEYLEFHYPRAGQVLNDYVDLKNSLSKIYGDAPQEEMIWKDRSYKNYPEFWSRALLSGDLKFRTTWKLKKTQIVLECYRWGDNYKMFYTVEKIMPSQRSDAGLLELPAQRPIEP